MPLENRNFDQLIDFTRTSAATFVNSSGNIASTPQSRNLLTFTQEFSNAAWTKTRCEIAPNVNPAAATLGAELVSNGGFASDTVWTKGDGWSIAAGVATRVSASFGSTLSQPITVVAGRLYAVTYTISGYSAGSVNSSFSGGTTVNGTSRAANGTYTEYLVAAAGNNTLAFVCGSASAAMSIDNVSVREVVGGALQAPDGTFTADKVIATAESGYHAVRIAANPGTASIQTFSFYAKAAEYTRVHLGNLSSATWGAAFDLSNGTVIGTYDSAISPSITSVGNGWYRCAVTFRGAASGWSYGIIGYPAGATLDSLGAQYTGDGVSGIFIWGAQLEFVPDAALVLGSEVATVNSATLTGSTGYTAITGNAVVAGATYYVTYTASLSAGQIQAAVGGTVITSVSTSGTYSAVVVAGSTTAPQFYSTSGVGSISNFSVKRITGTVGYPTDYTRNFGGLFPPRFDYDPVTRAPRGLLIEEQRTNLLLRSEEFDAGNWTKSRTTATANATTSPDGTVDADKITETTDAGTHRVFQQAAKAASTLTRTFSVYLKAAERTRARIQMSNNNESVSTSADVNLSAGTITNASNSGSATVVAVGSSITNAGNGWYRCTITATYDATVDNPGAFVFILDNTGANSYTGDGTSGIFVWGAQWEDGAFATSYIPTVASQVTRAADTATINAPNFASWYNQSAGSFVVEFQTVPISITLSRGMLDFDTNLNKRIVYIASGGNQAGTFDGSGVITASGNVISGTAKVAMAYSATDRAVTTNGGTVATGSAPAAGFTTSTHLNIGGTSGSGSVNGYIRSVRYYPTRLTNAQLQALTA